MYLGHGIVIKEGSKIKTKKRDQDNRTWDSKKKNKKTTNPDAIKTQSTIAGLHPLRVARSVVGRGETSMLSGP